MKHENTSFLMKLLSFMSDFFETFASQEASQGPIRKHTSELTDRSQLFHSMENHLAYRPMFEKMTQEEFDDHNANADLLEWQMMEEQEEEERRRREEESWGD